jgi:ribokinase
MPDATVPAVVVLGSVHIDLIATAARLPGRGESVAGGVFTMAPGGKGGNQACQFALAGAGVHMLARLGDDLFGGQLLAGLQARGVDTTYVTIDSQFPTGASTVLAAEGDYSSVIAPGAAARLSFDDVDRARAAIQAAGALAVQLELPVAVSNYAASMAAQMGTRVIFNASPAPERWSQVPESLWQATAILIMNQVEAGSLLGRSIQPVQAAVALRDLAARFGIQTIVITFGAAGSAAWSAGEVVQQAAFPAVVADTVGAGDAFLGVFSLALVEGLAVATALRRAAAAGALAVARRGGYDALPQRKDVDNFLAQAE